MKKLRGGDIWASFHHFKSIFTFELREMEWENCKCYVSECRTGHAADLCVHDREWIRGSVNLLSLCAPLYNGQVGNWLSGHYCNQRNILERLALWCCSGFCKGSCEASPCLSLGVGQWILMLSKSVTYKNNLSLSVAYFFSSRTALVYLFVMCSKLEALQVYSFFCPTASNQEHILQFFSYKTTLSCFTVGQCI